MDNLMVTTLVSSLDAMMVTMKENVSDQRLEASLDYLSESMSVMWWVLMMDILKETMMKFQRENSLDWM